MSTSLTYSEYGYWFRHGQSYVVNGCPLPGHPELGKVLRWTEKAVTHWSERNTPEGAEWWYYVRTEQPCADGRGESHELVPHDVLMGGNARDRHMDKLSSCADCGIVLNPEAAYAFGFEPRIERGKLTCDVAPYDPKRHGPFGGDSVESAFERAQQHLQEWRKSFGDGPYYVLDEDHSHGDTHRAYVISAPDWNANAQNPYLENPHLFAWAGPFEELGPALVAMAVYDDLSPILDWDGTTLPGPTLADHGWHLNRKSEAQERYELCDKLAGLLDEFTDLLDEHRAAPVIR
jgi:hypothetical protein